MVTKGFNMSNNMNPRLATATRQSLLVIVASILWQTGCVQSTPISPPTPPISPVVNIDREFYETLTIAQAVLQSAKDHEVQHPEIKQVLNVAITAYNTALPVYKVYHGATSHNPADTARLLELINQLTHSIAQLSIGLGAKL